MTPAIWDRLSVPPLADQLLDKVEEVRLSAYQDSIGRWTIGCGSTVMPSGRSTRQGDTLTMAQADALRDSQIKEWIAAIAGAVHVPITVNWAAPLISFTHNLGKGVLRGSTLVDMLNAGKPDLAANQLGGWVLARGQIELGLMRRRELERRIALGGYIADYGPVWKLTEAQLMPAYRQSFADAAAFHRGSAVLPGPAGTLRFTKPAAAVNDDAATDALNDAEAAKVA